MKTILTWILISFILFCSCNYTDNVLAKNALVGNWTIDSLAFSNPELFRSFNSNIITFKRNNELLFPSVLNIKYKVHKNSDNNYYLILTSDVKDYNCDLRIHFSKDSKNKLFRLNLTSDSIKIVASKLLYNFDKNLAEINYLIGKTTIQ